MKKKISLLLAAILAIGACAGCGSKKAGTDVKLGNVDINFGEYENCDDIPS